MASASRGPTPLAVCSSSNVFRSSSVANPYRVSESSRTTSEVATLARSPGRSPASVPGVHCTSSPTPPTSITAPSGASAATVPGPVRRSSPASRRPAAAAARRLLRRAPPQMTDRQRQRVGGVGRPRRVGQPQQPDDHLGDLLLVRPAVPGHRRLDLARRVQRDRHPAPGGARRSRPRPPARCPSRCARCAG